MNGSATDVWLDPCFESIKLGLLLQKIVLGLFEVVQLSRDVGPGKQEDVSGGDDEVRRHGYDGEPRGLGAVERVDELDDFEREAEPTDDDAPNEDLSPQSLGPRPLLTCAFVA